MGQPLQEIRQACALHNISEAVSQALQHLGIPLHGFSGISAHKDGLSTAIDAACLNGFTSCKAAMGRGKAARAYMALESPTYLFATWAAFDL